MASVNHFRAKYDSEGREEEFQGKFILFGFFGKGMIRKKSLDGTMIKKQHFLLKGFSRELENFSKGLSLRLK